MAQLRQWIRRKRFTVLVVAAVVLLAAGAIHAETAWRYAMDRTISSCDAVQSDINRALQLQGKDRREQLEWVASIDVNGLGALCDQGSIHLSAKRYGELRAVPAKLSEQIPVCNDTELTQISGTCLEAGLLLQDVRDGGFVDSLLDHFDPAHCRFCEAIDLLVFAGEIGSA
ncbi:hypothetical protein [Collinsella sp. An2]|uniref:hypothetical protein n=1 Tax=Collinsella sp. An2 TaxID=1965585 RepID=UPI000B3A2E44|nr:hypothetical protein [Collinsella sp. An2]OUP09232.1 hypothetical protein B5F33_05735 [Collinsella sp. An2]